MTGGYDIKQRTDLEDQGNAVQTSTNLVNQVTATQGNRGTRMLEDVVQVTADWAVEEKRVETAGFPQASKEEQEVGMMEGDQAMALA